MIKVNEMPFRVDYFPDGTQCLMHVDITPDFNNKFNIFWRYENDEELITLMYIVNYIRNGYKNKTVEINLYMPYIPNARMDRIKNNDEIFTLKFFTNFINGLEFNKVSVLDPHSDVSVALINRVSIIDINDVIKHPVNDEYIIADRWNKEFIIFFPDAGAYKRYKDLNCLKNYRKIYGSKIRDWNTGKILGLNIVDENGEKLHNDALKGKHVFMIDDIISYGGTLYHSAIKLNELGSDRISAYATHIETKSFWNVEKGTFRKAMGFTDEDGNENEQIVTILYTTNSLYNYESGNHVYVLNIENLN